MNPCPRCGQPVSGMICPYCGYKVLNTTKKNINSKGF